MLLSLLSTAGFSNEEARNLIQHLFQSGALSSEFIGDLLSHIRETETTSLPDHQQKILQGAAQRSIADDGSLDIDKFEKAIENIPPRYQLALIQAGHQRYFLPEVVVGLLEPTKYAETHKEPILELARQMQMVEEERINPDPDHQEPVHVGVCIGATAKTVQAYLENQKRIHENSTNPDDPEYRLYLLLGGRFLINPTTHKVSASDNPEKPTENFAYGDLESAEQQGDYLSYLSAKYGLPREQIQERHAVMDRFKQVYRLTTEQAQEEGWLKPINADIDAMTFIRHVAADLGASAQDAKRTIGLTNVQPFNRTYRIMMFDALEAQGQKIAENHVVKSDGGRGVASQNPTALMKEFAKIINVRYEAMAKTHGIVNPVDQQLLNGGAMKAIEQAHQVAASAAQPSDPFSRTS